MTLYACRAFDLIQSLYIEKDIAIIFDLYNRKKVFKHLSKRKDRQRVFVDDYENFERITPKYNLTINIAAV